MKIEITEQVIQDVVDLVAIGTRQIIANKVERLEDEELIAQIRAKTHDGYERVFEYLNHTRLYRRKDSNSVVVENRFLAKAFHINVLEMKRIREKLVNRNIVDVFSGKGPLTIRHTIPDR